ANGRSLVTIEGLDGEKVEQAFVEAGAVQCGFCTPGLVVAAHDLLQRVPRPTDAQIREALAGNICRCTGYAKIIAAVHMAAGAAGGGEGACRVPGAEPRHRAGTGAVRECATAPSRRQRHA